MTMLKRERPSQRDATQNPDKAKALAAVTKQKKYRLSVDLDESVYELLKLQSVRERRSGVDLVRDAISDYLSKCVNK